MSISIEQPPDMNQQPISGELDYKGRQEREPCEASESAAYRLEEEPAAKTEILTKEDLEIRKLHALRRAKEYLEEQVRNAEAWSENIVSEPSSSASPIEREYCARAGGASFGGAAVTVSESDAASNETGIEASYKKGAAISGYKTYKKETPKAWDVGDMDEKR